MTKNFYIGHFHQLSETRFYLTLVDAETKLKTDLFDYIIPPQKVIYVDFKSGKIPVISVEDQLVKTIIDIMRISKTARVDPKQFTDAHLLLKIAI